MDFEGDRFIGQVKNVSRMSLKDIEKLAEEVESLGFQRNKLGVLVVKRSAGRGEKTPMLYIVTGVVWHKLVHPA